MNNTSRLLAKIMDAFPGCTATASPRKGHPGVLDITVTGHPSTPGNGRRPGKRVINVPESHPDPNEYPDYWTIVLRALDFPEERKLWHCPTCGIAQPMPRRHPIGTRVEHREHGRGKIFSYDRCDDISCGVDFGRKGQWCITFSELTILQNSAANTPEGTQAAPEQCRGQKDALFEIQALPNAELTHPRKI